MEVLRIFCTDKKSPIILENWSDSLVYAYLDILDMAELWCSVRKVCDIGDTIIQYDLIKVWKAVSESLYVEYDLRCNDKNMSEVIALCGK